MRTPCVLENFPFNSTIITVKSQSARQQILSALLFFVVLGAHWLFSPLQAGEGNASRLIPFFNDMPWETAVCAVCCAPGKPLEHAGCICA